MGKFQFPYRFITGLPSRAQRQLLRNFEEIAVSKRAVGGCNSEESGDIQFPYRYIEGLPKKAQTELFRNFDELASSNRRASDGRLQFPFRFITGLPDRAQYELWRNFEELAVTNQQLGGCVDCPDNLPVTSGLEIWLDACDSSTITDAGSGAVSQWNDKSGNGHEFVQGTASQRMTTGVQTIAGRNVLVAAPSGGSSDYVQITGYTLGPPFTLFVVARSDNAGETRRLFQESSLSGIRVTASQTDAGRGTASAGMSLTEASSQSLSSPFILRASYDGANSAVGVNGDTDATGNIGGFGPLDSTITFPGASTTFPWDGVIAEALLYDSAIESGASFDAIMGYLAAKWGITLA